MSVGNNIIFQINFIANMILWFQYKLPPFVSNFNFSLFKTTRKKEVFYSKSVKVSKSKSEETVARVRLPAVVVNLKKTKTYLNSFQFLNYFCIFEVSGIRINIS